MEPEEVAAARRALAVAERKLSEAERVCRRMEAAHRQAADRLARLVGLNEVADAVEQQDITRATAVAAQIKRRNARSGGE